MQITATNTTNSLNVTTTTPAHTFKLCLCYVTAHKYINKTSLIGFSDEVWTKNETNKKVTLPLVGRQAYHFDTSTTFELLIEI